jgi:hypothetical protein
MNCPQHGEQAPVREFVVDTRIEDFDAVELACGCTMTAEGVWLFSNDDLMRTVGAAPWPDPADQAQVDNALQQINDRLRQAPPPPRGSDPMPQAKFEEFERSRDVILGLTAKMSPQAQRLMVALLTEQADEAVSPLEVRPQDKDSGTSIGQGPPQRTRDELQSTLEAVVAQAMATMPPEMRAAMGDPDNPTVTNLHVPVGDPTEALRLLREAGVAPPEPPKQ